MIAPTVNAEQYFAGARSVERLLESYRPRDEASYPRMRDLLARGRVRQAVDLHQDMLREAMVSSDLPILLSGTINLSVDQAFAGVSQNWRQVFRTRSIPNFQTQNYANLTDLITDDQTSNTTKNGIIPVVPENMTYSEAQIGEQYETAKLATRGVTFTLSRQALVNDSQSVLQEVPARLGDAMARTLNYAVAARIEDTTSLLTDGLALFHSTHANLQTGTTALSMEAIITEMANFKAQTSPGGRVLNLSPKYLIVPPELELTAVDILDQTTLLVNRQITATTTSTRVGAANLIASRLQLVVLEELTDANDWFLVADPGECSSIEVGFLDGRETPELFVSDGGGMVDLAAADGIRHKIRHDFVAFVRHYSGIRKIPGA